MTCLSQRSSHLLESGIVIVQVTAEHLRVALCGMVHGCLHRSCMDEVVVMGPGEVRTF